MNFLNLVKKGKHTAILNYIKSCKCLTIEEEQALITRGNHKEIMAYITYHYFEPDSFDLFIKRGKLDEVRHYLSCNQVVYDDMWDSVIELGSGVIDAVIDYILRDLNQFVNEQKDKAHVNDEAFIQKWESVIQTIILSGNHCSIRRLITQIRLSGRLEYDLYNFGSAEDNLVYELKWGVLNNKR